MADIDLRQFDGREGREKFNIIASFSGVFDGNGHTISNFTYDSNGLNYTGLFRHISGPNAEIKDLKLIDPNVNGGHYVGGLVGSIYGTITNCNVQGGSVTGNGGVGGLVGLNDRYGNLANCSSTSEVSGTGTAGGLVGVNFGRLTSCSSAGIVIADSDAGGLMGGGNGYSLVDCYSTSAVIGGEVAGGLVGGGGGRIDRCYSTGSVTGYGCAGGLMGEYEDDDDYLRITNCYSTCKVNGFIAGGLIGDSDRYSRIINFYSGGSIRGQITGGLFGSSSYGYVTNSFWDIEVSGEPNMCGYQYGDCNDSYGRTTSQLHQQSTFTDWDFTTPIWKMNCEGMSYPKLNWWQPILGDFLCPDGVDFFDYSFFTSHWQEDNCGASNNCDGTDLDLLGKVDIKDLRIFVDNWLRGF
jgi:hypothetical protein